ncbi:hypothetical protein ACFPOB_26240 [Bosea eneae]|uniref:Uncharacterized protein n=1 Tax=Bosea eneae TaxID=151454 RepID=A0ABW0IXS3_9HYPH
MIGEMTGVVVDVDACKDPLAAEVMLAEADPSIALLVIHSGRDQIRVAGLNLEHARLVALAVNAPYTEE